MTKNGKNFVKKYKSEISAPLSVHSFIKEMEEIEARIENDLREIIEMIEVYNEEEYAQENLDNLMEIVEDYFDEVRNKRL